MGKVHRIKRSFRKITEQQPIPTGQHSLGRTVSVIIDRRINGSLFIMTWGKSYEKLVNGLWQEYTEHGVGLSDKTSAKG